MTQPLDDAEDVIRRALETWNQGRLDEYLAFYDPGVVWALGNVHGQGLEGVPKTMLRAQLTAFPDTRMEIKHVIANGDVAALEGTSTGTNTGEIARPGAGARPPTGKQAVREVAIFVKVQGGRIVEFREYGDRPQLLDQV